MKTGIIIGVAVVVTLIIAVVAYKAGFKNGSGKLSVGSKIVM